MYENPITAFEIGTEIPLGPKHVSKAEIIEFASEFDPVFFHLDEEAAKNSLVGSLCASGFHTCAIAMRMMCDAYITKSTSQGAPGVDEIKWFTPVLPDDTLHGSAKVLDQRRSKSKPHILIVKFHFRFWNQNNVDVMSIENSAMFAIPHQKLST